MTPDAPRPAASVSASPHFQGEPLSGDADLASRWVGSSVLLASDESFGEKENLLNPAAAAFEPGHYGNRGEIVDGWETRRRREPGHDWALVRLGTPGVVHSVDVDTSYFTGNFPESCRVEGIGGEGYPSPRDLLADTGWDEIVTRSTLRGDSHNIFPVASDWRYTHIRLSVFPDGGVARFRVHGRVIPDPRRFDRLTVDLASQEHGGAVVASSDGFYTSAGLLNRPDRARIMGEGWETRRRRGDGHDHIIFRLALAGDVRQVTIDTAHFKYNASAEVEVFGAATEAMPSPDSPRWTPLLPRLQLQPDTRHEFAVAAPMDRVAFVRVDAYPDGGLSRVRVIGAVDPVARQQAGLRFINSLPPGHAIQSLIRAGLAEPIANAIATARPLRDSWRDHVARLRVLKPTDLEILATVIAGPPGEVPR